MLIGYVRASKDDQESAAQVEALKGADCERVYYKKASGGRWERPELHRLDAKAFFGSTSSRVGKALGDILKSDAAQKTIGTVTEATTSPGRCQWRHSSRTSMR
jgi:Resolvase, N terminal domain